MCASWLVLVVTVYVSLDVANPLMPGALTFGVADSVEVRQAQRFRGHADIALRPAAAPSERVEQIDHQMVVRARAAADSVWIPPSRLQRTRSSLSRPAAPTEDH
jgi:hypothetical protein